MRHNWTYQDNLLAIEAYYNNLNEEELRTLAIRIGVSKESLNFKLKNIEYLDTNGKSGFAHTSEKIKPVWEEYRRTNNIR
jgi:Zn-dependent peptidase ImmA (M78 family)